MMRRTLFTLGALLLLALFVFPSFRALAATSRAQRPAGDFSYSCSNLFITGSGILTADCTTENGAQNYTQLDLDPYIGNDNGTFAIPGDDFVATCWNIGNFEGIGNDLAASCAREDGTWDNESVNLDSYVGNVNGNLVWG